MLILYGSAFVVSPAGSATLDELFEALTLIQTERVRHFPVVLAGSGHWSSLDTWIGAKLLDEGTVGSRPTEAQRRHLEQPMTTPRRFGRGPIHRHFAAKVGFIMRAFRLPGKTRLWAAIGLMFIVAFFGAAPASLAGPAGAQVDHHVTETGDLDHLSAVDHDHIGAADMQSAPDDLADSLLDRVRVALPVLGLIVAGGVLWQWSPQHNALVGRGPPRGPLNISPGRDVLARLCISRR